VSVALISDTHDRIARAAAHYTTPFERELAIENLKWMSAYAPTHVEQVECRMLLLAMRHAQSFGAP
jgi:hypothetical protein